jgi:uncharacterized protein YndB with AHSA1/START domain
VAVDQPEVATVVEREVRIAARPETVFEFFTDPEKMVLWKGRQASLDPKPGGVYRVEMSDRIIARGEYVEVEAPSRVVFTWGWEGQEASGPLVRLRHLDLPEEARQIHGEGWDLYLGRLAIAVAGGDAGPDPAGVEQTDKEE